MRSACGPSEAVLLVVLGLETSAMQEFAACVDGGPAPVGATVLDPADSAFCEWATDLCSIPTWYLPFGRLPGGPCLSELRLPPQRQVLLRECSTRHLKMAGAAPRTVGCELAREALRTRGCRWVRRHERQARE